MAAALGIGAFVAGTRWFGGVPAVLAILIGSFLPFTVGISRQEVATHGIKVGDSIPHYETLDEDGQLFDSASLEGQVVLMKFFRGFW